jgi:hypothetical protein
MKVFSCVHPSVMPYAEQSAAGVIPCPLFNPGDKPLEAFSDVCLNYEKPLTVGASSANVVTQNIDELMGVARWFKGNAYGARVHLFKLFDLDRWEGYKDRRPKTIGAVLEREAAKATRSLLIAVNTLRDIDALVVPGYWNGDDVRTYANQLDRAVENAMDMGKPVSVILEPWMNETCGASAGLNVPAQVHRTALSVVRGRGCDVMVYGYASAESCKRAAQEMRAGLALSPTVLATGDEFKKSDLWSVVREIVGGV